MNLYDFFKINPEAAIAVSGGVDSAYLLYAGLQYGKKIGAYFLRTAFQPAFELEDAQRLTSALGVPLKVVTLDILSVSEIAENSQDRCYLCKRAMFSHLKECAARDGFAILLDGTNASDCEDDRPGMRALRELGVYSPLRECALTKRDIRRLSREAGLFTWEKPSYSCLATRVALGCRLTESELARVDWAEWKLASMGFSDFRIRVSGQTACLQVQENQMEAVIMLRKELRAALLTKFEAVLLDLQSRKTEEGL